VQCLKKMKLNECSLIRCAKEYLYPALEIPSDVRDHERFEFEVKLVSWTEVIDVNEGVRKFVLVSGSGYNTPKSSSIIEINYQVLPDGCIEHRKFPLWEGFMKRGVEEALEGMKKGEKAKIIVQPSHIDDSPDNSSELEVQVEMIDFQNEKESWDLTPSEKISETLKIKEKATSFYKLANYRLSNHHYERCVKMIEAEADWKTPDQEEEAKHLQLLCISNLSMCQLKLKEYRKAIENCTKVLKKEKNNIKALFRRAQAYSGISEDQAAKNDLEKAKEIDPENTAVAAELLKVLRKLKAQDEKDRKVFSKMFTKS